MFLQFLDLYGNPVYVRPERVDALRGLSVLWEGKPRAATLMVLTNRETFRLRGHVDSIKDAIEASVTTLAEVLAANPFVTVEPGASAYVRYEDSPFSKSFDPADYEGQN